MAEEMRTVVYVGPLRPGVTVGKPGRAGAVDAVYGVPVEIPATLAERLLQQGVWSGDVPTAPETKAAPKRKPETTTDAGASASDGERGDDA